MDIYIYIYIYIQAKKCISRKTNNSIQEKQESLKEIIGSNKILNNKVIRKRKQKRSTFSVVHVTQDVIIFIVNKWKKQTFSKFIKQEKHTKIFHQLTCKSQAIIQLLQCRICFIQYVDKSETIFNLRLNNHQKDSKKKDAISACTHFQKSNHIFQRDPKFVLIEQITQR